MIESIVNDLRHLLRTARANLGVDVAFISQLTADQCRFRYVDAAADVGAIQEGGSRPLDMSYCKLIAAGTLPEVMPDTRENPIAVSLSVTHELPIGAYLSAPIYMSDGALYGRFCCLSHTAVPSFNDRDGAMLRTFAQIAANIIERDLTSDQLFEEKYRRTRDMIERGGPAIVYQPIFRLHDLRIVASEALSRFPLGENRSTESWFKEAAEVGMQVELELTAIRNALKGYRTVWDVARIQLGLNASEATICDRRFLDVFDGVPQELIVIELTEHDKITDYENLIEVMRQLRTRGIKIAIDDVGAGYASMRHVLKVRPNILKLDRDLIRSIDADDLKYAFVSSLKHFGDKAGCHIVAEGVETEEELSILRRLGLRAAQGYHLARPDTREALLDRLRHPWPSGQCEGA